MIVDIADRQTKRRVLPQQDVATSRKKKTTKEASPGTSPGFALMQSYLLLRRQH